MKLKQIPEDFLVKEEINLNLTQERNNYSIIELIKTNWDSFKVIQAIAKSLKTKVKFIGFAGNKDKNAITTQYISIYKINKERIEKIKINSCKIKFLGYSINRINLGDLKGNTFKIIIRDLNKKSTIPKDIQLENYFDDQRFGNKANTHLVGKSIITRNFNKTCELLSLEVKDKDYVGVIRKEQTRLLRFYISSYQSYIWNKTLSEILKKEKNIVKTKYSVGELIFTKSKIKNFNIQFINFDTEENKTIDKILKEEGINREEFIIKEIPELITQTQERQAFIEVKDIKSSWNNDEINKNKLKLELSFFLPKGVYATMLIKKLTSILK